MSEATKGMIQVCLGKKSPVVAAIEAGPSVGKVVVPKVASVVADSSKPPRKEEAMKKCERCGKPMPESDPHFNCERCRK